MLAEASLALDSRLLGREGAQRHGADGDLEVLDAGGGRSGSDKFHMCAAIRRETAAPKATGWAKKKEGERERKRGFDCGGCSCFYALAQGGQRCQSQGGESDTSIRNLDIKYSLKDHTNRRERNHCI